MTSIAWVNTAIAIAGFIAWVYWALVNRKHWGYVVLPLIYLTGVLGLYFVYYLKLLSPIDQNAWSNFIRLYTLIIALAMPFIFKPGKHDL